MKSIRIACGLLLLLAVAACNEKHGNGATDGPPFHGPFPVPDVIGVTVSPNPAFKNQLVTIDASHSAGSITSFEFDFGDGSAHLTQSSPIATHSYGVVNFLDTHYNVTVIAHQSGSNALSLTTDLLVKDTPPSIATLNSGADKKAVIGEWIEAAGKNLMVVPDLITVDGVPAPLKEAIDDSHFRFRVPPQARAGIRDAVFTWTGYPTQTAPLDVKRYAVSTSARYDKVYLMDVAANEGVTDTTARLPVVDASTVKISPDGSTAYVTNGRFNFLSTGTITIIDLTADGTPAISGSIDLGVGPLFDIEPAAKAPLLVAGDALGIYLLDVSDPLHPVQKAYVSALFNGDPANDVAAADIAVTPDGSKIAVLNALSAQARIFKQQNFVVLNPLAPVRVNVGEKTQKCGISDDGFTLYVLGGGGEGAVPMDLSDPRSANVTAVDISDPNMIAAPVMAGPYKLSDMNGTNPIAPVPFDLAISKSNSHNLYVTTLDQGFTTLFNLLGNFFNNPSFANLMAVVNFLAQGGLNFGDTVPVFNADSAGRSLGSPMQSTLTAPTASDTLYNDHKMLQSSFRLWYDNNSGNIVFETGATIVDNNTHASSYMAFESESLSLDAVFGLFQPPFSFGDVAFQP